VAGCVVRGLRSDLYRAALLAVALLTTLAACGGGSTTKAKATPVTGVKPYVAPSTTAPPASRDAVSIERRLGCVDPSLVDRSTLAALPGPKPVQLVHCIIGASEITVSVWASHDDATYYFSGIGLAQYCAGLASGPHYRVAGDVVVAGFDGGTLAQNQALGTALGLPVTTVTCPS
jgi:hypothetical protein